MLLSQARAAYYESTKTASEIVRQSSFAGIAIVWLFRTDKTDTDNYAVEQDLFVPLILFAMCLSLDCFQYIYKSFLWGMWSYAKEQLHKRKLARQVKQKAGEETRQVGNTEGNGTAKKGITNSIRRAFLFSSRKTTVDPDKLEIGDIRTFFNWPSVFFFWGKCVVLVIGYIWLISALYRLVDFV